MKINCLVDFEIFLSNRYDLMYDKSIHIVNDQVNMFKLTKIQKNAMVHVLNRIMNYSTIENELYYQGSKPSDLIFYTLVKNIKEVYNNGEFIASLKSDLERFLKSNNQDYLYKVFDIAMSPPYGLRPHVAIIIVFDLIKDFWNDILLFMNNSFIPTIDSYELYDSILNRVTLQYSFSIFDNDHKELLTQLESLFDNIPLQIQGKSSTIRVCSGMYTWYMNLPVITQQKVNVSLSGMQFLSVISSSRTNPKDAILTLINDYTIGDIISFKQEIEAHFDVYLDSIRSNILKRLGIRDKLSWINEQPLITRKNNLFAYALNNEKDFIETYRNKIENIDITKWTKSSFDKLKETIILDVKSLNKDTKYSSIVVNGLEKHVQDVQLTRKAKTAYDNLINLIEATSRYYSDMELEQIVLMIIKKYIK